MSTLEKAIALAASAHAGQKDKAGALYILHPLRVIFSVESKIENLRDGKKVKLYDKVRLKLLDPAF